MLSITKVNVIQVCLADPQDGGLEQPSLPDVVVNIIFCCPDKGELPGPVVSPLNPTPVDAPVTVSGVNELITSGELPKKENANLPVGSPPEDPPVNPCPKQRLVVIVYGPLPVKLV
jgi:hypothetical protein